MKSVLALAIKALSFVEENNASLSSAIIRVAKQLRIIDRITIAKAGSLARNTLHRKNFIDRFLDLVLAPDSVAEFNISTQSFLRIFVFKTKFDHKTIGEATKLVGAGRSVLGWKCLKPFEEVFGKILKTDCKDVLSGLDGSNRISFQKFYPDWLVNYCIRILGRRELVKLLSYSSPLSTNIRINTLKRKEEILKEVSKLNIALDRVKHIPHLYRVTSGKTILTGMEMYAEGLIFLQDELSCLASILCEPQKGHVIFDVGVRPIVKTLYLAQLMNNAGRIFSIDTSVHRIERLKKEAERAGVEIIEYTLDTGDTPIIGRKADTVLLSPMCSGTGVFWRDPSLK